MIGLGFMGSTHLRAWQNVADARVAAVYSDDEQKLTGDLSQVQGNLGGTTGKLDFFRRSQVPGYWRAPERSRYRCGRYLPADISSRADHNRRGTCGKTCAGREADGAHRRAGGRDDRRGEEGAAHADDSAGTALYFLIPRLYDAVRSGNFGKVRSAFLRRRCAAPFWNKWLSDEGKSGGGVFDLLIHDVDFCLAMFELRERCRLPAMKISMAAST